MGLFLGGEDVAEFVRRVAFSRWRVIVIYGRGDFGGEGFDAGEVVVWDVVKCLLLSLVLINVDLFEFEMVFVLTLA